MKKMLTVILAVAMIITFTGCNSQSSNSGAQPNTQTEEQGKTETSEIKNGDGEVAEPEGKEVQNDQSGKSIQNEVTNQVDIAFVTYSTGIPYFDNAWEGAYEAAKSLGLSIGYYGPASNDTAGEIEILDALITKGVKGIVVTCMDSEAVTPTLKKARDAGIVVVTWDLDISNPEGRDYFVNLCSNEVMAEFMMDVMYKSYSEILGDSFEYAIITSSLTSEQMVARANYMVEYAKKTYPGLIFVGMESGEGDAQKNYNAAVSLMQANPNLKVIMSNASDALGPIAEAIAAEGRIGEVYGAGMTTPNLVKPGFESGAVVGGCMLWSPAKWADFAVHVIDGVFKGETYGKDKELNIEGFPDAYMVSDDEFWYMELQEYTPENIGEFNF